MNPFANNRISKCSQKYLISRNDFRWIKIVNWGFDKKLVNEEILSKFF